MTAQGKPDRCPMCGSDERTKCNLLPTPAGYEDLCCDDWHSSPVPAAAPQPTITITAGSSPLTIASYNPNPISIAPELNMSAPQAESVPSGKQPFEIYDEFLQQYSDSVATNCQPPDVLLVWMVKWAIYYAASQTAALAAERDSLLEDEHEDAQIAAAFVRRYIERVAELERSNSLLRERITAAEGLLKKCDDIAMDERVPNHKALEEIVREIDAYFEKENQ